MSNQPITEELPLQVKLQNRKGAEAVPSLKTVRRSYSNQRKRVPHRKGPMKGSAAPLIRGHDSLSFRRVIVKARIIKMTDYGQKAAVLHLRYLDREGTAKSQEKEGFFDLDNERIERQQLTAVRDGEPHQFRLIVSPEDGARLDLKSYSRELMAQVENDLGRELDWYAVNHYNTDNPHSHIVIHGLDKKGEEVFIDREYISHGIRHQAERIATKELGLRMEHEITQSLQKETQARYLTKLDRQLVKLSDQNHYFELPPIPADTPAYRLQRAQVLGRLTTLQSFGLVEKLGPEHWKVSPDLTNQLRQLNKHETGLKRLQDAARTLPQPPAEFRVHTANKVPAIDGVVLDRGLSDEMSDQGYLVIGDRRGVVHHLEVNNLNQIEAQVGHLVTVEPPRKVRKKAGQSRAGYTIQLQHRLPLKAQIAYPGRTYLDSHYHDLKDSDSHHSIPQRLKQAVRLRRHWLQQQGLQPGTQNSRLALDGMERETLARKFSQQTGLSFRPLATGESFNGKVINVVSTPAQRPYLLVGDSKEFAMVPWQSSDGKQRGHQQELQPGMNMVIGINAEGRTWTKALGRGLSR